MKLKNPKETPVNGGFLYYTDDGRPHRTDRMLRDLVKQVDSYLKENRMPVPTNLAELIEDQICTRQPEDKCMFTKGLGDRVTKAIHAVAGAVDAVVGTELKKKARGCSSCSKRRTNLN